MNAPESAAVFAPVAATIPLDKLRASKTNPRKHFDAAALAELTASIKEHGILQPILVRPLADALYEIVAGERRFRAAKAAGLAGVPALVREISDVTALEMQVIENLQRSDLHPLEEAEGYEALMKLHKATADEIAAKVGKSRAYVYATLKLCALSPAARKAFYDGKLNRSTALLVARIPGAKLQDQATKEVITPDYRGDAMPVRQVAEHIHRTYMLRLKDAPFSIKDAQLVSKAGACGDCPKRTGNQPELFADIGNADVCTDPACFSAKKEAHFAIKRAQAEAKGQEVISGKEAKAIAPYGNSNLRGYSSLTDTTWTKNDSVKISELVKKLPDIEVKLLELPESHELISVVSDSALKAALKKAGLISTEPRAASSTTKYKDDQAKKAASAALERSIRRRILDAVRGRMTASGQVTREDGVAVALEAWDRASENDQGEGDDIEYLAMTYGWITPPEAGKKAKVENVYKLGQERIPNLSVPELWRVMLDLALITDTYVPSWGKPEEPKQLLAAAERHGVDHAAIRAELVAEAKAKVATERAAKKPKTAKAKGAK